MGSDYGCSNAALIIKSAVEVVVGNNEAGMECCELLKSSRLKTRKSECTSTGWLPLVDLSAVSATSARLSGWVGLLVGVA